jgi:hypothetical protein
MRDEELNNSRSWRDRTEAGAMLLPKASMKQVLVAMQRLSAECAASSLGWCGRQPAVRSPLYGMHTAHMILLLLWPEWVT